jgi:hypothetical protein
MLKYMYGQYYSNHLPHVRIQLQTLTRINKKHTKIRPTEQRISALWIEA